MNRTEEIQSLGKMLTATTEDDTKRLGAIIKRLVVLKGSGPPVEIDEEGCMRLYEWVKKSAKCEKAFKNLSDTKLADLLCEHIQVYVSIVSPQYDLLDVIIERLKQQTEEKDK